MRSALTKSDPHTGTTAQRDFAIQQLIDRAEASTEIVDILAAAGFETPDISVRSDDFLGKVQAMEKKNLALEALKKLLGDEIRSRSRSNVVESKRFSERLEGAIARYHMNAVSTVEVINELIQIAHEVRESGARSENEGLTPDEIAFYDALAENESAVEDMGNEALKAIAHILMVELKKNITVDWAHREQARARLRVLVKDILEEHGYPPDLSREAVQTVLQQTEVLSHNWTVGAGGRLRAAKSVSPVTGPLQDD